MKTVLRAPAELFAISVLAEVAVWERRPELQRLFLAGQASGKVDETLVSAVLPGLSASACRNVLRTLVHLRLVDVSGGITAFGAQCGQSGEAPAWELGVFTFLVAKHECFGAWPIGFKREKTDGQDRAYGNLGAIPRWFAAAPNRIWEAGFAGGPRFTIASFPNLAGQDARCRETPCPPALLVWEMDLLTGANLMHVEGAIAGAEGDVPFRTAGQSVAPAEVGAFFANWEPRWSQKAGRLLMPYDGAADKDGFDSFTRDLTYTQVQAGARGLFSAVTVETVPVAPGDASEAAHWATALAVARVRAADAYVAPTAWTQNWSAVIAGSPLGIGAGDVPLVSALVDQRTLSPRLRWLLAAGSDLAME